ncbi:hypothetical protein AAFF_G00426350 [Aldrovandia affinis]|uniref:G-protein coupled receptors family 1 profile domain-containing protein n=1 Tax=Aldrovandia affinis TaxID=143900 RepID=A0AAD7S9D8_9TELE|nr:hypothetical protein AAFF_G00426350 [Aldrovandia affinis]
MSASDFRRLQQFNKTLHLCNSNPVCDHTLLMYHNITNLDNVNLPGDGSPLIRGIISVVFFIVCALGVMGNMTVLYLLQSSRNIAKSTINFFVFNLAIADLLFSMVQPFWAVDVALDFSWPFGWCMCKAVSLLTAVNVYASVFFLTAMSVMRYCVVATALKPARPRAQKMFTLRLVTCLIWAGALLAAAPSVVFSSVANVGGDQLCLLRFPEGTFWLAVHHLLRVILGFLLPYTILIVSYLLLLCFICNHNLRGINPHRRAHVSNSVAVVVLSFCVCWFPYNIITFWGILIKLDVLEWTSSYYVTHVYVFPLATCLAHINTCMNPVIYCLARKEFRTALRKTFWRSSPSSLCKACLTGVSYSDVNTQEKNIAVQLKKIKCQTVQSYTKNSILSSTALSVVHKNCSPFTDMRDK